MKIGGKNLRRESTKKGTSSCTGPRHALFFSLFWYFIFYISLSSIFFCILFFVYIYCIFLYNFLFFVPQISIKTPFNTSSVSTVAAHAMPSLIPFFSLSSLSFFFFVFFFLKIILCVLFLYYIFLNLKFVFFHTTNFHKNAIQHLLCQYGSGPSHALFNFQNFRRCKS
jgi:hypothetical protein